MDDGAGTGVVRDPVAGWISADERTERGRRALLVRRMNRDRPEGLSPPVDGPAPLPAGELMMNLS